MALPPVRRFTAWPKPPRSTARSPIHGCATYWKGCHMCGREWITKCCCRGTARQRCHGKREARLAVGVVHGSDTLYWQVGSKLKRHYADLAADSDREASGETGKMHTQKTVSRGPAGGGMALLPPALRHESQASTFLLKSFSAFT